MKTLLKARKKVFKALQLIDSVNLDLPFWVERSLRSNEINIAVEHTEKSLRELMRAIDQYLPEEILAFDFEEVKHG